MSSTVPKSVPLAQQRKALLAFADALGINADAMYFPMIVERDRITFPHVPSVAAGRPPAQRVSESDHPQGIEYGELAVMVTIEVEQ